MAALTWDDLGKKIYETGVDRGVLYIPNAGGVYDNGVAWNGLTAVTESPSGAAATSQYADNTKYMNLISAEEFAATLEAYTYPDEFAQYDGLSLPTTGVAVGQQARKTFGLSYRTKVGNDVSGDAFGYKIHLLYGCQASPSEKAYKTVNDSPEGISFSWSLSTNPVNVSGLKPTALITIDSTKVVAANLTAFEIILYGTTGVSPALPMPDAVVSAFSSGLTAVTTITPPSYVNSTHIMTIPTVTGVDFFITKMTGTTITTAQALAVSGAQTALAAGQSWIINARAKTGYYLAAGNIDEWKIDYASADRAAS